MEVQEYKFTVQHIYIKGSLEVQEYKFTSLQYNIYIKGSLEVQEYKITVHCLY